MTPNASPTDTTGMGDVTLLPTAATEKFIINKNYNETSYAEMSYRRFGFINFTNGVPDNIDIIMADLAYAKGAPVESMQGV